MFHHPRNWRSSQLPCIPWDWIYPAFFFQLLKFEIVNLCQTEQGPDRSNTKIAGYAETRMKLTARHRGELGLPD